MTAEPNEMAFDPPPTGLDGWAKRATIAAAFVVGVSALGAATWTLGATGGDEHAQQDTLTASTSVTSTDGGHIHSYVAPGPGNRLGLQPFSGASDDTPDLQATGSGTANITSTAITTVTSSLTGSSQNMPPAGIVQFIIYLGV